jgi:hypothetical protein
MRITTARLAGLATLLVLLLGGAGMGEGPADPKDPKKPAEEKKPSQLEELIAQALQGNPDVRVAEAKMREAEAELNRTRLQVIQKVVAHQHNTEALESAVKTAESRLVVAEANVRLAEAEHQRMVEISKKGVAAKSDVDAARAKVQQAEADVQAAKAALQAAKADHAKAQAELPYLLGKATKDDKAQAELARRALEWLGAHQADDNSATARALYALGMAQAQAAWQAGQPPRGTVAEKLRQALDAPVSMKYEGISLGSVLKEMADQAGVTIVTTSGLPSDISNKGVTVSVSNLPRGACFQLLEDLTGVRFGVREYGIVATDKLPAGVMPLHDFWKAGDKPKPDEKKK